MMTLIRKDFEDESCLCDPVGRFIIVNVTVQGVQYVFANIYAPNNNIIIIITLYLTTCHPGAESSFKCERETNYKQ